MTLRTETGRPSAGLAIELAYRESGSIAVALLWCKETDALTVCVEDHSIHENFELVGVGPSALDAFYHPYAYAALRGVEHASRG
jgi:hypothetical protein